jgi:hypothetical protein
MAQWARSAFEEAGRLLHEHERLGTTATRPSGGHARGGAARISPAWTVARLADLCRHKGIIYDESSALTGLSGLAAASGDVVLIRVRADLEERERVATLARELGHVYRAQHRQEHLPRRAAPELLHTGDPAQERDADIWAAHCLVLPEVYETARVAHPGDGAGAIAETAERLNIPERMVRLWLEHRDAHFGEDPRTWLARS